MLSIAASVAEREPKWPSPATDKKTADASQGALEFADDFDFLATGRLTSAVFDCARTSRGMLAHH